jgi:hypothetical protein
VASAASFQALADFGGALRKRILQLCFLGVGTHRRHPCLRLRGASEGLVNP